MKRNGISCYVGGGDGVFGYDSYVFICTSYFTSIICFMKVCYVKIYNAIKKVFRNAQGGVSEEERPMRSTVSEQRLLVQFIIITCFFLFCWGTLIADVVLE